MKSSEAKCFLHADAISLLQPFMGPRYPPGGPRPGVRLPQMGSDFNGVSNHDKHWQIPNPVDFFGILKK